MNITEKDLIEMDAYLSKRETLFDSAIEIKISAAYQYLREENKKLKKQIERSLKYAVVYGNYFPREIDSTYHTKAEADDRCEVLNSENDAEMWQVEEL